VTESMLRLITVVALFFAGLWFKRLYYQFERIAERFDKLGEKHNLIDKSVAKLETKNETIERDIKLLQTNCH